MCCGVFGESLQLELRLLDVARSRRRSAMIREAWQRNGFGRSRLRADVDALGLSLSKFTAN